MEAKRTLEPQKAAAHDRDCEEAWRGRVPALAFGDLGMDRCTHGCEPARRS